MARTDALLSPKWSNWAHFSLFSDNQLAMRVWQPITTASLTGQSFQRDSVNPLFVKYLSRAKRLDRSTDSSTGQSH